MPKSRSYPQSAVATTAAQRAGASTVVESFETTAEPTPIVRNSDYADSYRMSTISTTSGALQQESESFLKASRRWQRKHTVVLIIASVLATTSAMSSVVHTKVFDISALNLKVEAVVALGYVSVISAILSAALGVLLKLFHSKVIMNQTLYTLAEAKLDSVREKVSRALVDGQVTHDEYVQVQRELDQYRTKKREILTAALERPATRAVQPLDRKDIPLLPIV